MLTAIFFARPLGLVAAPLAALLICVTPARTDAQAQTGILSLSVTHSTLKNTAKPTGDLKAQVDSLDLLIASASRFGRTSELRRLYAHSIALERPLTARVALRQRDAANPRAPLTLVKEGSILK